MIGKGQHNMQSNRILFSITLAQMLLIVFTFTPHLPTHPQHHLKLHTAIFTQHHQCRKYGQHKVYRTLQRDCYDYVWALTRREARRIQAHFLPSVFTFPFYHSKINYTLPVQLYVWAKIAQKVDMMKRPGMFDLVVLSLTLFLLFPLSSPPLLPPLPYKDVY